MNRYDSSNQEYRIGNKEIQTTELSLVGLDFKIPEGPVSLKSNQKGKNLLKIFRKQTMEAKPVEATKSAAPEPAKQSEVTLQKSDPKPQVAQAPCSRTEVSAVAPAPIQVTPQVQEPSKPKEESHFKPAHDDFYANIFYFSGMGSLIGSALASGVYVPEKNQRNALDADEVDQAKTRQENATGRGGEIVVTARNQAQGLSTDFRQLQALLESLPTFTDAGETKPYDRRAVDEPIHAHIYFSHEQKQQQQRGPVAQSEPRKGGGSTQSLSSAQEQKTTGLSFPDSRTASRIDETQKTASDPSTNNRAASKPDQTNQYSYPVQDRVTSSQYQHQQYQQGQPSTRDTTEAQDGYGSRVGGGGGPGSGILDSIDQFDRSFRAAEASNSSNLSFGSSATALPPHPSPTYRASRQETETTTSVRQYVNPADHGVTRPPAHQQGRPTSSPRPYADQRGVDSTGIKPWQLSHLRPLEAKGYNVVAEQERSFSHGGPRFDPQTHSGASGARSPYQQKQWQEVHEETPVVSVTARQSGSINQPYAATLVMPYCDL